MRIKPVTDEEKAFIRENAGKMSLQAIADKLGRCYSCVAYHARTMNMGKKKHHTFTLSDEQFIMQHFKHDMKGEEIAAKLGVSKKSLYQKVCQMKAIQKHFGIVKKWG